MRSLYLFFLIISLFSLQPFQPQLGEVNVVAPNDNVAAQQIESKEERFSQSWFQQASGELHKRQYNIKPVDETNSFAAVNVKNQLGFLINPKQLSIKNYHLTPSGKQWQVNLVLSKINQQSIHDKTALRKEQHSNYLKYSHNQYSIEYINTPDGLRQNFIIPSKSMESAPLTVQLAISGDLTPKLINSNGLAFYASNEPDEVKLIYDDLKVWDAHNNILPAHMELSDNRELRLVIDDSDAVYPVTIDPLNRAPDWQDGGAGLLFPLLNDLTIPLLYGHSVSGAGDLNNDGFDDIIIGAPAFVEIINVSNGTFNPVSVGAAFIYFGSATGPSLEPNEILQPTTVAGALVGFSVSSAGDLNNDGFDDVIIGAPGDRISLTVGLSTATVAVGKAYVYHGNSFDGNNSTPPTVTAAISLRQSDFGVLPTTPANPLYGFSVSHAGDVNNDGFDDIVVGSPTYTDILSLNAVGRSDIYLGSATGVGSVPNQIIKGTLLNGLFGLTVNAAGNVNNDAFSDVIIGAPGSVNLAGIGNAYVFHGNALGITANTANDANTRLQSPGLLSKTLFGYDVSDAGDVNGDGFGDVIIGEPLSLELFGASLVAVGKAHIFYGSAGGVSTSGSTGLTSPRSPSFLGSIVGNLLYGFSVSGVDDVNCDGLDDIIVGEPGGTAINLGTGALGIVGTNALSGQAYIYYGRATSGPANAAGLTYRETGSISVANLLGTSVRSAGDYNGDGSPDYLIGAPNGTLNLNGSLFGIIGNTLGYLTTNSSGNSYGYFGCDEPPTAVNDVATTTEDTPISFNVTTNDFDTDGTIVPSTVDLNTSTPGIQSSFSNAQGSFSVNAAGNVLFTPTLNFNGNVSITYTVNDNSGKTSNEATILVTVTPINDPPLAVNDNISTIEEAPVVTNVTTNDSDVDGTINAATVDLDPITGGIQSSVITTQGTYSVNASGDVTFTPATNFNGSTSIFYTVNDNEGLISNAAEIFVTVISVNDPPVAVDDNAITNEDTPITFNVSVNDTDVDGTVNAGTVDLDLTTPGIQSVFSNAQGSFTVNSTADVTFTPLANFNGFVIVNYTINDNSGATSNAGTISINVVSVNDPPIAGNDLVITNEDTPITFNTVTNDTDIDGSIVPNSVDLDPVTGGIQSSVTTAQGTFSVNATGEVTFTPLLNFNGNTSILYTVNDNNGLVSNQATISITVNAVNDAPVLSNDAFPTNTGVAVNGDITNVGDFDPDGTALLTTTTPIIGPANGMLTINSDGTFSYTPNPGFNGTETITIEVCDSGLPLPGLCRNQTLTIVVSALGNLLPVAVNDNASTNEDTPVTFNVTTNDTDADGTIIASSVDLNPTTPGIQNTMTTLSGSFSVDASGGVTFSPALNFNGNATLSYTVNDNSGATSNIGTITILVTAINDAPVAVNDNATTIEDNPVTFNVTTNDTDPDGTINVSSVDLDPATPAIQNTMTTASGTFNVDALGSVTFTPVLNFNGNATLAYTVNDNNGATSNSGTITISVTPVNDAPVAVNDNPTTNEGIPVTFNVTGNDTDVDGAIDPSTVDLDPATPGSQNSVTTPSGTFSVDASGDVTFVPELNFNGNATLTYTVNDNSGTASNSGTIAVSVTPVNDAPIAVNDNATTNEDTQVTFNVTANDTDADGTINAGTVDLNSTTTGIQNSVTTPSGTFSVNASGDVTFVPALNFSGNATLIYTVNDNSGATSNSGTITVSVTPVNDAPVAINDNATTNLNTSVTLSVTTNDTDVDGTIEVSTVDLNPATPGIQNTLTTPSGTFSVTASGSVTFVPIAGFTGATSTTYTVLDNDGLVSNNGTITITINGNINPQVVILSEVTAVSLNSSDCSYDFTVTVSLTNTGNSNLSGITITDNLMDAFASPAGFQVLSITSDVFNINTGFNGSSDIQLLTGNNSLAVGEQAELIYNLNVTPNGNFGPYQSLLEFNAGDDRGGIYQREIVSLDYTLAPLGLFIPEGFSPNGDGVHDTFDMTLPCGITANLLVFNRWGDKVYVKYNYQNNWDGYSNEGSFTSKALPEGTYFYKCELTGGSIITGFITLKR